MYLFVFIHKFIVKTTCIFNSFNIGQAVFTVFPDFSDLIQLKTQPSPVFSKNCQINALDQTCYLYFLWQSKLNAKQYAACIAMMQRFEGHILIFKFAQKQWKSVGEILIFRRSCSVILVHAYAHQLGQKTTLFVVVQARSFQVSFCLVLKDLGKLYTRQSHTFFCCSFVLICFCSTTSSYFLLS